MFLQTIEDAVKGIADRQLHFLNLYLEWRYMMDVLNRYVVYQTGTSLHLYNPIESLLNAYVSIKRKQRMFIKNIKQRTK